MITATDLKTDWGNYFRNEGQGAKDIMKAFLVPSTTDLEWAGRIVPTTQTQERKIKSSLSNVLQPFQTGASPAGDLTLAPLVCNLTKMKFETDIDPDTIEVSYAGFLANLDTNDRKQWPITRYIVEEMIAKGNENWELEVVYKGEYAAPTPGTAGAVATTHDGLKTQIADAITAGDITAVNSNASWDSDPEAMLVEIETWIEAVAAVSAINRHIVENYCDKLFISKTLANRMAKGIFKTYNSNYNASDQNIKTAPTKFMLPFANIEVIGLPSMNGQNRVIMTPAVNRNGYIKRPTSSKVAELYQSGPRELLAFADFHKQVSFWDPAYMFVNQLA
jgi:hypothetical protein